MIRRSMMPMEDVRLLLSNPSRWELENLLLFYTDFEAARMAKQMGIVTQGKLKLQLLMELAAALVAEFGEEEEEEV